MLGRQIDFCYNVAMPEIRDLAAGSSTQRGGLNHQAIEDYLKTIYSLAILETPVSTSRLAEAREVRPASATGMIRRLAKLNLVHYEKHRGVTLTEEGKRIALEVLRHHRLIEAYLIEALGFTWDEVHEEADILEHVISEKLEERIAAALGNPQFDPHGAPIPTKELTVPVSIGRNLTTLPLKTPAVITRILYDEDRALLKHLTELGITLNTEIEIIEKAPFDGHLTLCIDGTTQTIGFQVATAILVSRS